MSSSIAPRPKRAMTRQAGATLLEYLLILSLFSVPLSIFIGETLQKLLRDVITKIVETFTAG